MSGNGNLKHRGLRGNILLTAAAVILGGAVAVSSALMLGRTPAAKPAAASLSASSSAPSGTGAVKSSSASASSQSTSAPVTSDTFLHTVFIGDSFTDGLRLYCGIDQNSVICSNSMTAYSALNRTYSVGGKVQKVSAAAAAAAPDAIFVMLGTNDLAGGYSTKKFAANYTSLVEALKKARPGAKLYVQSVLPVTQVYDARGGAVDNEAIRSYNSALEAMCKSEGVTYADVSSVLAGADGYLPSDSSTDGLHLKKAAYTRWLSYLAAVKGAK